jgi:L-arabinose 1-dehydrogenase
VSSLFPNPILHRKAPLTAALVATFDRVRTDRAMTLAAYTTRCIRAGDVHELLVAAPRTSRHETLQHVGYLGFAEFERGGVMEVGDAVTFAGRHAFRVLGFDETHAPNHLNIVLAAPQVTTGFRLGLEVGEMLVVRAADAERRSRDRGLAMAPQPEEP